MIPSGIQPAQLCSVSHLRAVDGCPLYTEYFKTGDDMPARLCTIHEGTFKQAATRVFQSVVRTVGERIAGLFRRRH